MARAALNALADVAEVGLVADLNHDGEGVVRGGKTVFIAGALPGEEVRFTRAKRHRAYDEGRLLEVIVPSAQRVVPACPAFGVCGGCALQHLDAGAQLAAKALELQATLTRVAGVEPQRWLPPLQGPVWNYRRRARLGARYVTKKGRALVGFRERATPYVAELETCSVLAAPVGALLGPLGLLDTQLSVRRALPQIEVAVGDDATALVLRILEPLTDADRELLRAFAQQHGVRFYLQPGGLNSVVPLEAGHPDTLCYRMPEWQLEMRFRPTDFIQVNGVANRALIAQVLELLELDAQSHVLDLFCGLGNFTLPIARHAASVHGIEGDAGLVARAAANAALNGIANATFATANLAVEGGLPLPANLTHVLLDPPRTGAREMLPAVMASGARRIVYVSCHPGSLARDLGILVNEHGCTLLAAGAVDMFPHTNHVESVAVLDAPRRQAR